MYHLPPSWQFVSNVTATAFVEAATIVANVPSEALILAVDVVVDVDGDVVVLLLLLVVVLVAVVATIKGEVDV